MRARSCWSDSDRIGGFGALRGPVRVAKSTVTGDNAPMKKIAHILLTIAMVVFSGCAPEIGLRVSVPNVPELQNDSMAGSAEGAKIKVGSFTDGRSSDTIVVIDGRRVSSEGELGPIVQEGFTRYFRQTGMRVAILNAPMVEGTITEWKATVTPSFPSSQAKASARLKVTVRDTRSHPIYFATFSGEATASDPLLDEESVQKLLAQAMGSAIEAAVKDEAFTAQIARGRIE